MWVAVTYEVRRGKQTLGPWTNKTQHTSVESAVARVHEVCAVKYPGGVCTASGVECDPPAPEPKVEPKPLSPARAAKRAKREAEIARIMAHKGISEDEARMVLRVRRNKRFADLKDYAAKRGLTQEQALTRLKRGRS